MLFKRVLKNEKGQTAIEYILLIAVAMTICLALYKKMDEFVIKNPNSLISKELRRLKESFEADSSGRYTRFSLRK